MGGRVSAVTDFTSAAPRGPEVQGLQAATTHSLGARPGPPRGPKGHPSMRMAVHAPTNNGESARHGQCSTNGSHFSVGVPASQAAVALRPFRSYRP